MKTLLLITMLAATVVQVASAEVLVEQPWVRSTVATQKATGAFMTLKSDKPTRLVGVRSSAAKIVEVHEMKMENDVMKMRAVDGIDIAPGTPTELKPGSYHVMLIDLVKPLTAGEKVSLTLEFKGADGKLVQQKVDAEVRALTAGAMKK